MPKAIASKEANIRKRVTSELIKISFPILPPLTQNIQEVVEALVLSIMLTKMFRSEAEEGQRKIGDCLGMTQVNDPKFLIHSLRDQSYPIMIA
jgi:hypothetical protein